MRRVNIQPVRRTRKRMSTQRYRARERRVAHNGQVHAIIAGLQSAIVLNLHNVSSLQNVSTYHKTPQLSHIQCYGLALILPSVVCNGCKCPELLR